MGVRASDASLFGLIWLRGLSSSERSLDASSALDRPRYVSGKRVGGVQEWFWAIS